MRGCSWTGKGAFQNAMIASPIYLSIVPLFSWMITVIAVK